MHQNISKQATLRDKLQDWSINHIFILRNAAITDLLRILYDEGHTELPRTAETLLKTKKFSHPTKIIPTGKSNNGMYTYFGIEEILKIMLRSGSYNESYIVVLVNTDGASMYKSSNKQCWPIQIKIFHQDYVCKPATIALYCGDSKPKYMKDFLTDFVDEANKLIRDGLIISGKKYTFEIKGFSCDTPARSMVKCSKGHGGFCACERCNIKGKTVNKRRVYPQIDCPLRTKESFLNKTQKEHHKKGEDSPLTKLLNFDPVRQFFLDPMHLLSLGVMKSFFEKYTESGSPYKLSRKQRTELNQMLKMISAGISTEFQRKKFDINDLAHWKATQYQFILLYVLPFLFKRFISIEKYKHFLLLFVACRILFKEDMAVEYADYANALLRKFFKLMPMYGKDSQTGNFHNLIHIADDVKFVQAPMSSYSAFSFESSIGQIVKLVRGPNNPLVQISRRLHEIQSGTQSFVSKNYKFSEILKKDMSLLPQAEENNYDLLQVNFRQTTLKPVEPDNIVWLSDDRILEINRLFMENNKLKMEGYHIKYCDAFSYPCSSKFVGVVQMRSKSKSMKNYDCSYIKFKCLKLKVGSITLINQLLHK